MPEFEAVVPRKIEEAVVDFGAGPDSELTFNFDANKVTPRWFDDLRRRGEEDQDVLSLSKALADVIVSWNLTEGGQPAQPTEQMLSKFPIKHLLAIMDAVANVPASEEGNDSSKRSSTSPPETSTDSTSELENPQPSLQNGEVTSPSPVPSASLSER